MTREGREVWAKRVERWRDSGLTLREFAAEIGVNANTLAGWRWRLSSRAAAAPAASERRGPAFLEFVAPVEDREGDDGSATRATVPRRGAARDRAPERPPRTRAVRFDEAALQRVVAVLEAR
jgi:transposase-like protein